MSMRLTAVAALTLACALPAAAAEPTPGPAAAAPAAQVAEFGCSGRIELVKERDGVTLALGGLVGLVSGRVASGIGLATVDVLGVALLPAAAGVVGIYMANEGYFDGLRARLSQALQPGG